MKSGLRQSAYDVVIVGSGHNGLIAAAYLASGGLSVAVLERKLEFGGATVSERVFPEFEARLSRYSYLVSLLPQTIIDELQLDFATRRRRIASCTPYQTVSGGRDALVISNIDTEASRMSMRQLCGSDADWSGYYQWQSMQRRLAERVWPSLLEPLQNRDAFQGQLNSEQLQAWQALVERPLGESLESYVASDLVRGLLLTDAKIGVFTHAHDSSLLQNRCFLYHIVGQGTGEWQVPVGGMQALTDSLLRRCRALGVELLSGASVERLTTSHMHSLEFTQDDRLQAVDAKYVLINAGASVLARLCNQSWSPTANDEGSVVKVNMLLKRLPQLKAGNVSGQDAFAGSFHVNEGYQQMQCSYEQASAGEIPTNPPFEIYCHTLTDSSILSPQLQSQGYHTLTLFGLDMPYRLFVEGAERKGQIVLNRYLDALDELCQGSFRQCLASDSHGAPCIEIKLPQDLERELGLDLGNIFHTAPSWFFAEGPHAEGTWGVETSIDRVYCSGSSAHRGGAVSGIPGRNAAMAVLARERQ